ncbi:GSCOCG00002695001-RA-CDS [Cotesia congregata]|nr:GSCOCG00002695001-RA-CDS [Cotesia congregata]
MMQGAEMSSTLKSFSTVGSYLTSGNDGSSFHVQKNKRTQTKSQVHRSVSDARSDQNDKKDHTDSEPATNESEPKQINLVPHPEPTEDQTARESKPQLRDSEIKSEDTKNNGDVESTVNNRKRAKPLYRESLQTSDTRN